MAAEVGDKKTFPAKDEKGQGKPGLGQHDPIFKPLNRQQFHFSIWYFLVMLLIILSAQHQVPGPQVESIDYSAFKAKIESGEIHRVQSRGQGPDRVRLDQGPVRSRRNPAERKPTAYPEAYRTRRVDDPGLVQLMDQQGHRILCASTRRTGLG